MYQGLLAGLTGRLHIVPIHRPADIKRLVGHTDVDTLTAVGGLFQFWVATSTRDEHRRVNRAATEIYYATTRFRATDAPLLRGTVLITGRDPDTGHPRGLNNDQMTWLANAAPRGRDYRRLMRRCVRDLQQQLRAGRAEAAGYAPSAYNPT